MLKANKGEKETMSRKKDGEKAALLQGCGELLFGCPGDIRVTQGIYVAKKSKKMECFCKRAVWVPNKLCSEHLRQVFSEHGADITTCLTASSVIGICGRNPTRTAHATDSTFMVLAQFSKKKFIVVALVSIINNQVDTLQQTSITIREITTDPFRISETVSWIKNESAFHVKTKAKKRQRSSRREAAAAAAAPAAAEGEEEENVNDPRRFIYEYDEYLPLSPEIPMKIQRGEIVHDSPAAVMTPMHQATPGISEGFMASYPGANMMPEILLPAVHGGIEPQNLLPLFNSSPVVPSITSTSSATSETPIDPGMPSTISGMIPEYEGYSVTPQGICDMPPMYFVDGRN